MKWENDNYSYNWVDRDMNYKKGRRSDFLVEGEGIIFILLTIGIIVSWSIDRLKLIIYFWMNQTHQ